MKRAWFAATVLLCGLAALSAMAQAAPVLSPGAAFAGTWEGKLETPGGSLRIVFHVAAQPDGTLKATMDSPDQGATGIPVNRAVADENALRLECQVIGGSFYGSLEKDGTLLGLWSQGGGSLRLLLKRATSAPPKARAQEPRAPYPYKVEEVTYPSRKAGVTLAATLTIPEGKGPFPAVLLVPGSGPVDRDETVFGHKPFLVLADYLTRRGIAVLRADKRGIGESTGDAATAVDADYVDDALGGVAYLKSRKEIDPRAIGIAGHSEGGLVAPRAAVASRDVAFIVLMAAPGLPGEQLMLGQQELLLKASGADEATIRTKHDLEKRILDIVLQDKSDASAAEKIREVMKGQMPESAVEAQLKGLLSPWYRDFLAYDPRPTLGKVTCPVLAIAGQKDLQVPPVEDLTAIRDALKAGADPPATFKLLPGLNHLFQEAGTGLPSEYGSIEQTLSPTALQAIGDWVLKMTKGR
jgi:fermentation-respiration switch protein FrsA (DUF1100 family)